MGGDPRPGQEPPADAGGSGDDVADACRRIRTPPILGMRNASHLASIRDLRLVAQLLKSPDWEIPEGAERQLPAEAYLIARDRTRDAPNVPAGYSPGTRLKAIQVVGEMKRVNRAKLAAGVRLRQLGRKQDFMEKHPELVHAAGGGVNVVIYVPQESSPDEFVLPRETPKVIDAQPSGNGNGKVKG
jgi:hypothetical protein